MVLYNFDLVIFFAIFDKVSFDVLAPSQKELIATVVR
jgi:hypothetical protein